VADPRTLANLVTARAESAPGFLTYRGFVKERPAKGYVSLYFSGGVNYPEGMTGTATRLTWSFRAVCVGFTDDQALYVVGKMRGLFTNWRPLEDRSAGWFTEAPDDPTLIRDDSIPNDVRYSITPRFTITTRSA
jgi:hypothetical protein